MLDTSTEESAPAVLSLGWYLECALYNSLHCSLQPMMRSYSRNWGRMQGTHTQQCLHGHSLYVTTFCIQGHFSAEKNHWVDGQWRVAGTGTVASMHPIVCNSMMIIMCLHLYRNCGCCWRRIRHLLISERIQWVCVCVCVCVCLGEGEELY